jgi:hypothetical protein
MMAHPSRVIQRRFAAPRFRREIKSGQHRPESVATFNRNQRPVWTGIDGHFSPEYARIIIDHLKLTFVAERPPPPHLVYQELLVSAETSAECFP